MTIRLTISDPLYRQYLHHLFYCHTDGSFVVKKTTDFGAALVSFVRYTTSPVRPPAATDPGHIVTFILPQVDSLDNAKNYNLYYTLDDSRKLSDLLALYFDLDFNRYYLAGKRIGDKQKDIIMSFIQSRKLSPLLSDIDTLKKRQYRTEIRSLDQMLKKLINRAYRRNEKIEYHAVQRFSH